MNNISTRIVSLFLSLSLFLLPSSASNIYVTPTLQTKCPGNPCQTLSQYANESAKHFVSNTAMIFLPGTHTLNAQIHVTNVSNFSMMGEKETKTLIICSGSECGGFFFKNVLELTIHSLSFSSVSSSIYWWWECPQLSVDKLHICSQWRYCCKSWLQWQYYTWWKYICK